MIEKNFSLLIAPMIFFSSCLRPAEQQQDASSDLDAGVHDESTLVDSGSSDQGRFDSYYPYDHYIADTPAVDAIYHPDRIHYDASFDAWCAPPRRFTGCIELDNRFSGTAIELSNSYRGCGQVEECKFTTVSIQCEYGRVELCPIPISTIEEQSYQQDLAISKNVICGCMQPVDSGAVCTMSSCAQQTLFCENYMCVAR